MKSWKRRVASLALAMVAVIGITAGATALVNRNEPVKAGNEISYDDIEIDPMVDAAFDLDPLIRQRKVTDEMYLAYLGYNYDEDANTLTVNWRQPEEGEFDENLKSQYDKQLNKHMSRSKSEAKIIHEMSGLPGE